MRRTVLKQEKRKPVKDDNDDDDDDEAAASDWDLLSSVPSFWNSTVRSTGSEPDDEDEGAGRADQADPPLQEAPVHEEPAPGRAVDETWALKSTQQAVDDVLDEWARKAEESLTPMLHPAGEPTPGRASRHP